ncbi:MAG TPA: hypothetical protein VN878_04390 [Usitatibacter sp.]|nr:hypothetical protein [Usitatibacter sp.]
MRLPIGIGDSRYKLRVKAEEFDLAGGELFDFRLHGFSNGVSAFRVGCIKVEAMLDPANMQAFPTELTFVSAGRFTGTQQPLTRDSSLGNPDACASGQNGQVEIDNADDNGD